MVEVLMVLVTRGFLSHKQALGDLNLARYAKQSRSPSKTDIATLMQPCEIPTPSAQARSFSNNSQDLRWVTRKDYPLWEFLTRLKGNEHEVGEGIKDSGIPRDKVFITSKLWNTHHPNVAEGLEKTLNALGTDYLDLYVGSLSTRHRN